MVDAYNLIDLFLVLVAAIGLLVGWRRGFIAGTVDLLLLATTFLAALWSYRLTAALIERHVISLGVWAAPVAFLVILVLARILLGLIAGGLLAGLPAQVHRHPVNRLLGIFPGLALGLIHAAILALVLLSLPLPDRITLQVRGSALADQLAAPAEWLEATLAPVFEDAVSSTLGRITVAPDSRERIPLPFTVTDAHARPDLESRMLQLLNEERARHGLKPLQLDPDLTRVARAHSGDMFARGYFSHLTPEGKDPFDRMRQLNVRFMVAGENLALARTLPLAHQGLMDSPGHRANILRPGFGRVGIGVLDGRRYGLMVTQNFRN
ncbi:CvpA family protein [Ramlibacter sp. AN1015]|uniref:CAP domain-containing protein n=1 Tax=Ramlibacter sp. AN1015 TaxID=3133428 RepID=UPI0030BF2E26